jgi:hypothetical protein
MKEKEHLTSKGALEILKLKEGMNLPIPACLRGAR